MRLLGVLFVIVCIQRTSAQTCAVGQVLVNSACTYNDPALKIWYKFEAANPKLNSASASFGALSVNSGTDNSPVASASALVLSTVAKEGARSLTTSYAFSTLSQEQLGTSGIFTLSFWIYLNSTYDSVAHDNYGYETGWESFLMFTSSGSFLDLFRMKAMFATIWDLTCRTNPLYDYSSVYPTTTIMNTWAHIVITMQTSQNSPYTVTKLFYVNGVLRKTDTSDQSEEPWGTTGLTLLLKPEVMKMDDFRIYSRVLTAAEAMWLYKPCGEVAVPLYFETYACSNVCNAGYTGPDGGTCVACTAGKYKTTTGSVACTNCAAGTYSGMVAATTCLTCPGNSTSPSTSSALAACKCNLGYTGSDGGTCTACAAGSFKNIVGSFACTLCPASTYSSVAGASSPTVCVNCAAGTYSTTAGASSSTVCVNCAAGTYSGVAGATLAANCIACPVGSTSGTGATACISASLPCNAGYTGPDGSCTACVAGKYKTITGSAACTDCGAGTYSTSTQATVEGTCLACPSNSSSYSASSAAGDCTCNAGFTGPNGDVCSACVAGKYKINTGSVTCTNCLAGTYSSVAGATLAANCIACPAGSTSGTGATACISASLSCNAGYTGPDGSCSACGPGTYKITSGSATCSNCGAGTYSGATAATDVSTCLSCPSNSNSPSSSTAAAACTCAAGYSGPAGGPCSACALRCQAGFVIVGGSCVACTPGTYT